MKPELANFSEWIKSKEYYLPGLYEVIKIPGSKILLIGASVFELYHLQGWIPALKRQTSDFDLSVALVADDKFYVLAKEILLKFNYKQDNLHPYRFHPPKKISGGLQYIDLLAHPLDEKTEKEVALNAMGVEKNFSLSGFTFATANSYPIENNLIYPNIFGMLLLKIEAYIDEPTKRIKDFADILEMVSGFVDKGMHFNLEAEWNKIKGAPEANKITQCLEEMTQERSTRWDIEDVRFELNKRLIDDSFIDTVLIQQIKSFLQQLK